MLFFSFTMLQHDHLCLNFDYVIAHKKIKVNGKKCFLKKCKKNIIKKKKNRNFAVLFSH